MPRNRVPSEGSQSLALFYIRAKLRILRSGFAGELIWQEEIASRGFSEPDLIREGAGVILCSGMRESTIRSKFKALSKCFCGWSSARLVHENRSRCEVEALRIFRHPRKISAICDLCTVVASRGFASIAAEIQLDPYRALRQFSYIGPITVHHLAKNLGFSTVKPDRHLVRIAALAGFSSPSELCKLLSQVTGDSVQVVDLVLWRFAASTPSYVNVLSVGLGLSRP